jgi:hypothetical protein
MISMMEDDQYDGGWFGVKIKKRVRPMDSYQEGYIILRLLRFANKKIEDDRDISYL